MLCADDNSKAPHHEDKDAVKYRFYVLVDHLKWHKTRECNIWETLFLWAFGQDRIKVCKIAENARRGNTK